jgi:hypothetical protein
LHLQGHDSPESRVRDFARSSVQRGISSVLRILRILRVFCVIR